MDSRPLQAVAAALIACAVAAPHVLTGDDLRAEAAGAQSRALVERDVRYGPGPGSIMDVYRPRAKPHARSAAVLVLHGGGWRFGDKRRMATVSRALAAAGFVAFNANYALATPRRAGFPHQLRQLRGALRWIERYAVRYRVDPRRLGVLGSSAGAHLAALVATTPAPRVPRPRAVVTWSAPFELTDPEAPGLAPAIASFVGCRPLECPARHAAGSPVTHVTGDDPAMLIVASQQELVPIGQSRRMASSLRQAGVPHRLWELTGSAHAMQFAGVALDPSIAFLRRRLR